MIIDSRFQRKVIMKSRQKIKALKLIGVYDRRGKKYNNLSPLYYYKDCQNLRRLTSNLYESEKFLKKFYSGRSMKIKEIIHITNIIKASTDLEQKESVKVLPKENATIKEEWRNIEGYEGLYKVSNFGRIASFQGCNQRIMKPTITHKGYQSVGLCKEKQHNTFAVHRLVAKAFIPNPSNLPQVNHKDECKTNNRVDNLEWCTASYNNNYGTYIERQRNFQSRNTPVLMFDLNGNFEKEFISMREAAREMNTNHSLIGHCCNGHSNRQNHISLKGKLWCHKGEEDTIPSKVKFIKNYKYRTKTVVAYFPDGTSKEYESATKASKEIKISRNKLNKDGYDKKSGLRWTVC